MEAIKSTEILGTKVSTEKRSEIHKKIIRSLKASSDKFYIVTPNPEIIMYALKHKSYQDILNHAQVALPDGIGVLMAGKFSKKGISQRITGVDFMEELTHQCAENGLTTGFFGGKQGVAEKTAECLRKKYPNLKVAFMGDEWGNEGFETAKKYLGEHRTENGERKQTRTTDYRLRPRIDVLFVALGFPKQEKWIAENLENIPVKCAMGVGGSFDYISGSISRAPKAVRSMGLEWAYRLILQPWRIKRQMVLPVFAYKVIKEKMSTK